MRWIIRGDFVAVSQISVHTGAAEDDWPDGVAADEINVLVPAGGTKSAAVPVQGIELDAAGRPFLPATALKGLVRAKAAQSTDEQSAHNFIRLLGDLPRLDETGSTLSPIGGLVEFRNAWQSTVSDVVSRPALRGKTELSEGTRTADDGQLRHDRIVAPGSYFAVEFVLARANANDVALFLALLAKIDGVSSESAIGSSTSQGDGRVRWKSTQVLRFGAEEARAWLDAGPDAVWMDFARAPKTAVTIPELDFEGGAAVDIPLEIHIDGHFLVSALGSYTNDDGEEASIRRPFRTAADDTTTARLPGASLDGALRAQARRIYRTISGDALPWAPNDTELPPAFESLFGSADQASFLETETLLTTGLQPVRQEFVAIDRFSGGQSEGKKFALEAFEKPLLRGNLKLRLLRRVAPDVSGKTLPSTFRTLLPSAVGLLALCLKDLACGDIPLGHATRKGYGGVQQVFFDQGDWKVMLANLSNAIEAQATVVPGFEVFQGLKGESAIRKAVELLQVEAAKWAIRRKAANSGEVA